MNATEKRIILPFFRKVSACSVHALSLEALSLLRRYGEKRRKPSLRKAEKEAKKLGKKGARADVRAACVERAGGRCEATGAFYGDALQLDHYLGRAISETVETCWMLCSHCHSSKTENHPTREWWDRAFAQHCRKYGYPIVERLTKQLTGSSK